jgi:hypothetical protein
MDGANLNQRWDGYSSNLAERAEVAMLEVFFEAIDRLGGAVN